MFEYLKGGVRFVMDKISNEVEYGINQAKQGNIMPAGMAALRVMNPMMNTTVGAEKAEELITTKIGEGVEKMTGGMVPALAGTLIAGVAMPGPGELTSALKAAKGGVRLARAGSRGKFLTQGEFDVLQPQRIAQARDKVDLASETVENIEAAFPGINKKALKADKETGYKSAVRSKEDAQAIVSSEESNILTPTPDNQYAFPRDTPRAKELKIKATKENEELGRILSVVDRQLEMHHLFPKGVSAAIYNRARDFIEAGKAHPNTLKRLAKKLKKATGVDTGDLESNMLPMQTAPHSTFHTEMRYQPSLTFPGEKLEMSKEILTSKFNKVKSFKEFETLVDKFIDQDIIPLIQTGKNWQPMDDVIKSISPKYTGKAKYKPKK